MGLIDMASGNSVWRGLDYYKDNKVTIFKKLSDFEFEGTVSGSNRSKYNVFINIEHPRQSKCNCPHAKDTRIICKHMISLYFTVFPKEADNFIEAAEKAQRDYEEYEEKLYNKTINYIYSMKKEELINALIEIIDIAPEWVYDKFVREHVE